MSTVFPILSSLEIRRDGYAEVTASSIDEDVSQAGDITRQLFEPYLKAYFRLDKNIIVHGGKSLHIIPKDSSSLKSLDWDVQYEIEELSDDPAPAAKRCLKWIVSAMAADGIIELEKFNPVLTKDKITPSRNSRFLILINYAVDTMAAQVLFSYTLEGKNAQIVENYVHLMDLSYCLKNSKNKVLVDGIYYHNPFHEINRLIFIVKEGDHRQDKQTRRKHRLDILTESIHSEKLNPAFKQSYMDNPIKITEISELDKDAAELLEILAKQLGHTLKFTPTSTQVNLSLETQHKKDCEKEDCENKDCENEELVEAEPEDYQECASIEEYLTKYNLDENDLKLSKDDWRIADISWKNFEYHILSKRAEIQTLIRESRHKPKPLVPLYARHQKNTEASFHNFVTPKMVKQRAIKCPQSCVIL
jgi:hypothetical protein